MCLALEGRDSMTHNHDAGSYGQPDELLGPYLLILSAYNATFGSVLWLLHRSGRWRSQTLSLADVLLFSTATFKISRLLAKVSVTSPFRAPFTQFKEPAGDGEVTEEPRGTGLRHALGEFVTCPFCLSQWVAAALVCGWLGAPRETRLVSSIFTVRALSEVLQLGYAVLKRHGA